MGDLHVQNLFTQPSPPPPPLQPKSNMPMLYYGLVVIGTAALVLALYNLIIIKWCTQRNSQRQQRPNSFSEISTSNHEGYENNLNRNLLLLSSFKYKKESGLAQDQQGGGGGGCDVVDYECAVCLSVFEEGEEGTRGFKVSTTCRVYTASQFSRFAGFKHLRLILILIYFFL
nr:RING-H2 finger protein ATL46-like [Quercus suber]